jgi:hypothetical protein
MANVWQDTGVGRYGTGRSLITLADGRAATLRWTGTTLQLWVQAVARTATWVTSTVATGVSPAGYQSAALTRDSAGNIYVAYVHATSGNTTVYLARAAVPATDTAITVWTLSTKSISGISGVQLQGVGVAWVPSASYSAGVLLMVAARSSLWPLVAWRADTFAQLGTTQLLNTSSTIRNFTGSWFDMAATVDPATGEPHANGLAHLVRGVRKAVDSSLAIECHQFTSGGVIAATGTIAVENSTGAATADATCWDNWSTQHLSMTPRNERQFLFTLPRQTSAQALLLTEAEFSGGSLIYATGLQTAIPAGVACIPSRAEPRSWVATLPDADVRIRQWGSVTNLAQLPAGIGTLAVVEAPKGLWDDRITTCLGAATSNAQAGVATSAFDVAPTVTTPTIPAGTTLPTTTGTTPCAFTYGLTNGNDWLHRLEWETSTNVGAFVASGGVDPPLATSKATRAAWTSNFTVPTTAGSYRLRVRARDQAQTWSSWSAYLAFTVAAQGSVAITTPAADSTSPANPNASVVIGWTYTGTGGSTQAGWELEAVNDATGAVLYTFTATTLVNAASRLLTSWTVPLPSDVTARVRVRVVESTGLTTPWSGNRLYATDYDTPPPPALAVAAHSTGAAVIVTVTNPTPGASQPDLDHNDIYRTVGGVTVRVATGVDEDGVFTDWGCPSGVSATYAVAAVGVDNSSVASTGASITLRTMGVWVHRTSDPGGTAVNLQYGVAQDRAAPDVTLQHYAGRTDPVAVWGEHDTLDVTVTADVAHGPTHAATVSAVRAMWAARDTVCVRDGRGNVTYGAPVELSAQPAPYGTALAARVTRSSWAEAV